MSDTHPRLRIHDRRDQPNEPLDRLPVLGIEGHPYFLVGMDQRQVDLGISASSS